MDSQHISIAQVTRANWRAALLLTVAPEQQRFIADYAPIAALGLAKAYIRPGGLIWTPYAFFAGSRSASEPGATGDANVEMVGFTMLAYEPERADVYWIFHFFIDQRYQGRGFGALALRELIAFIHERHPDCRAIHLTVHPDNRRAQRLYTHAGFRSTGELLDGEPHYALDL
ncbi:MAG TPA: GNAT family N-acetyltransferase [Ktedonobacterales bacterium]|jgi:diamine N-acetyltransferase|nr:GNAT family N-acetyltransferase [Ktedonobacterales bacterium]